MRGAAFAEGAGDPSNVAIVAERLGRYAGIDPLGRELVSLQDRAVRYRIIGVAREARELSWDAEPMSTMYLPFKAERPVIMVVRAEKPLAVAGPVRKAIQGVDGTVVADQMRTLDDLMMRSVAERRFNAFLYGAFSLSALALTMIGIYGLIAYAISRRQREIGIRVALGATKRQVILLVVTRLTAVLTVGTLMGLLGLLLMQKTVGSMLYQLQPIEPASLATTVGLIVLTGLLGAYVPMRRATRVDPMIALRAE
jgi:putative ABC transport system permease protein